VLFPLPAPRNLQIQDRNNPVGVGKEKGRERDDLTQSFVQYLVVPEKSYGMEQVPIHYVLSPKTPRDDVLRGRWDEATGKLVEALDQVRFQKGLAESDPDLPRKIGQWFRDVVAADADLLRATKDGVDLERAQARLAALWVGGIQLAPAEPDNRDKPPAAKLMPARLPTWLPAVLGWAADPMGADATYLLALAKQEKAERNQARLEALAGKSTPAQAKESREAWETASNWWRTYLNDYPSGIEAAAARLGYARTLEALDRRAQAHEVLSDLAGNMSPLDETARLHRAKLLK
jgi:hypothetical protein